jgi:hypothetical protein
LIEENMAASLLCILEMAQNMKESEGAAMICEQHDRVSDAVIRKETEVDEAKAHVIRERRAVDEGKARVIQLELGLENAKTKLAKIGPSSMSNDSLDAR